MSLSENIKAVLSSIIGYQDIYSFYHQISLIRIQIGVVAQMVERSLSMRQARGSMPRYSSFFYCFFYLIKLSSQSYFYYPLEFKYYKIHFLSDQKTQCLMSTLTFRFSKKCRMARNSWNRLLTKAS